MSPSRWDYLFERKPLPLMEHLLAEVARLLAQELSRWPLPVAELDLSTGSQFAPLLAPDSRRPSPEVFEEAFRLARLELERELEAYQDYLHNRRFLERGLSPEDKPALLFISRWLLEQLLGLGEATEGRVNRARMLDCLERIRRASTAAQASPG